VSRGRAVPLLATVLSGLAFVIAAMAAPPAALARSEAARASAARAGGPPVLAVSAAALYAPQTGQTLYGVADERPVAIASTTKLMTALVTLEHVHHLGVMFTQNDFYAASVDSQIGLVPGERMSVHDLLVALMLPSADDAAEDLAYNVGHGSVARFVEMMNAEARRLGLRHTHYTTPIGLDTPGNYSTASDLVRLADYDLRHSPYFARIVALRSAVLHTGPVRTVVNRNDLVGAVPWIDGVKTGHTGAAGYVLVASGHRSGMTLISAVLGTASESQRDATTMALLGYGFGQFSLRTPVHAGQILATPTVKDRPGVHAALAAASTLTRVVARRARISLRVTAPRRLTGPLPAQAALGTVVVLAAGRPIARIPLVLTHALPKVGGLTVAARFITRPLTLVLIVLAIAAATAGALARRRRRRGTEARPAEMEPA
jgi:D-alanyl-D-alanine carboxypeptidase (penicillin-binding protein 5/6)